MITIYDNKKTFDRFTLVVSENENPKHFFGFSENPLSPNGFNQFLGTSDDGLIDSEDTLGKLISFDSPVISADVWEAILHCLENFLE